MEAPEPDPELEENADDESHDPSTNPEFDFDDLAPDEQEAYLAAAEARGEDVSLYRARKNSEDRRDWAKTAELVRLSPEYDDDDVKIAGLLRRFHAPFDDVKVRDYALRVHGGGDYAILYYDSQHRIRHRDKFEVGGRPKTARESEDVAAVTPVDVTPPAPPPSGGEERGGANADYERRLADMEHRHAMERMEQVHRDEIRRLEDRLEKSAAAPKSNGTVELVAALGTLLAPFAPAIVEKLTTKGDDKVERMLQFMKETNADTKQTIKELLAEKKGSDPLQNAASKMLDLAIASQLAPKKDPEQMMFSMMEKMIPHLTERALDIATMNMGDKDEESGPMKMLEKFGDMVKPLLAGRMPGGPASALPMASPYPYPPMIQPAAAAPAPQPTPGVYPYTHMAPPPPGPAAPQTRAPAGPASAMPPQPMAPQPMAPQPMAPTQAPAPAAPGQPGPGTVVSGNDEYDIHPQLFVLALQWLNAGKDGSELAHWVDDELEKIEKGETQGPRLLTPTAIEYLETMQPAAIIDHFFAAAPPELLQPFLDPQGRLAPHARSFVLEFMEFFFSDDTDSGDAAEGDAPATAPPQPVTASPAPTAPAQGGTQ